MVEIDPKKDPVQLPNSKCFVDDFYKTNSNSFGDLKWNGAETNSVLKLFRTNESPREWYFELIVPRENDSYRTFSFKRREKEFKLMVPQVWTWASRPIGGSVFKRQCNVTISLPSDDENISPQPKAKAPTKPTAAKKDLITPTNPTTPFKPGTMVTIHGMNTKYYNGMSGILGQKYPQTSTSKSEWRVRLNDGRGTVAVPEAHLAHFDPTKPTTLKPKPQLKLDDEVIMLPITGPDYAGKRGKVTNIMDWANQLDVTFSNGETGIFSIRSVKKATRRRLNLRDSEIPRSLGTKRRLFDLLRSPALKRFSQASRRRAGAN